MSIAKKKFISVSICALLILPTFAIPAMADSQFLYFKLTGVDKPQETTNKTTKKTSRSGGVWLPNENMAGNGLSGFTHNKSKMGTRLVTTGSAHLDATSRTVVTKKDKRYDLNYYSGRGVIGWQYYFRASVDSGSSPTKFQVWGYFNADS